jgi:integrase/recombinase XerD
MREDLPLRGLAPRTQPCDVQAVHQLAQHYRRAPDQRSEEARRQSFLCLLQEKQVAESPFRIALDGIKCCDAMTRQRPWPVLARVRPRKSPKLPLVLRPQEVRSLLAWVDHPTARRCLRMLSACGLRLTEGTQLQVSDLDPPRRRVRGRRGTGGKDRDVPRAERPLGLLRAYGPLEPPRPWLFPARRQPIPLSPPSLQTTFNAVVRQRGSAQEASIHTLRPSYATHLRARGVSLRVIPARLGHKRPSPTARYTPLTPHTFGVVHATSNALMAEL